MTLFPDGVTIDAKFSTLEGQPLTEATVGDDYMLRKQSHQPDYQSWETADERFDLAKLCSLP